MPSEEGAKRIEWASLVVDVAICRQFAGFILFIASILVFIKARSLRSLTSSPNLDCVYAAEQDVCFVRASVSFNEFPSFATTTRAASSSLSLCRLELHCTSCVSTQST